MNDPKGKAENPETDDDWEFTEIGAKIKYEENNKIESQVKNTRMVSRKKDTLKLDQASVPKSKTRSAMAIELQNSSDNEEGDVYSLAPLYKRGGAFIIDLIFGGALVYAAIVAAPFLRMLIQLFLDKYKLQLILPESFIMNGIVSISVFLVLFFCIVIPIAFFNHSLGKKILGLKVRGNDKYTISISQAFKRELILKPLSILILVGFVTPFFSKKKLSIHDMVTNTFVIEDSD